MNKIHPTALIEGKVKLGQNNEILPYSVLYGPLEIGDNNLIGPHVIIGTSGEDTKDPRYDASNNLIKIGNNNIIREYSVIQKPRYEDSTQIGNDAYLMTGAYVPHDAILYDGVTLSPHVAIGGISRLMKSCTIGMGASVHQYSIIGQYSMVAANSAVIKNVKPFSRFIPGKPISINLYAIKKYGFEAFEKEIASYVLEDIIPHNLEILLIIEEFMKLHLASKRRLY
jgi:UDP-N-acetylglucosamine acyltransferase